MTDLIRIPRAFYIDHQERDLPTPGVVRSTKHHLFVRADDPAIWELLNDAEHYAGGGVDVACCGIGLVSSAQATARALKKGLAT
ncbi:hypothetical protein [Roseinatronobacter sp. NSM]|uniref:hypothetical protein n=1 Tax=Roseinatronobacter sp. NSM TaxID=3457785 RepID=UPI00403536BD